MNRLEVEITWNQMLLLSGISGLERRYYFSTVCKMKNTRGGPRVDDGVSRLVDQDSVPGHIPSGLCGLMTDPFLPRSNSFRTGKAWSNWKMATSVQAMWKGAGRNLETWLPR